VRFFSFVALCFSLCFFETFMVGFEASMARAPPERL